MLTICVLLKCYSCLCLHDIKRIKPHYCRKQYRISERDRDIYSGHSPPPHGGRKFLSKVKNREGIEGGIEKRKGKEEKKKKRVIKHRLKYLGA